MHRKWLVIAGLLAFAAPAAGQSGDDGGSDDGAYTGVTPGSGRLPAHVARARESGSRLLTWPGFQMRPDGASRFFVQVSGNVETSSDEGEGRFTVLVEDTKLHHRNNARPLETRHFNTPVRRAKVERRGKDLAFVLELRKDHAEVTPFVRTEAGPSGFQYVFVEFPPGEYVPGAATPEGTQGGESTSGGGTESSGASGASGDASGSTNIRVHGGASGESGEGEAEASGSAGFSVGN